MVESRRIDPLSLSLSFSPFPSFLSPHPPSQEDVSPVQSENKRPGQKSPVRPARGHRVCGRLSLQVPQFTLDGGRQGRPGDAREDVHSPGQPAHRRAVDGQACKLSQTEADQQHLRQTRVCKYQI